MDSDPFGPSIVGLVFSFLLSTLFSVTKIVFNSVDKNSLPSDSDSLRFYAAKVEDIRENKPLLNATISFGKTLSNCAFVLLLFLIVVRYYPRQSWISTLGISLLASVTALFLFAYTLPRALAQRFPLACMPLVYMAYSTIAALLFFFATAHLALHKGLLKLMGYDEKFAFLSKEERERLSELAENEQALDEDEKDMIHSIFDLGETIVKEIMVPRVDVEGLELQTDFQSVLSLIKEMGHSRIPVYKDNVDNIVGVLYAKDVLGWISDNPNGTWNLAEVMKQPHFVPTGKKIDDLLAEFKSRQIHMAIVVDEYGGTAGIVTLEDILEEIVGEIQDEYDEEEAPVVEIDKNLYKVDPHFDLDDLKEKLDLDLDLEDVDYNTLGGLIYHEVGDVPDVDALIEHNGIRIKVLKMDNQRIEEVQIEVLRRRHDSPDMKNSF